MNLQEIFEIFDEDSDRTALLRKTKADYSNYDDTCSYSGLIALPIKSISTRLDRNNRIIPIEDEIGVSLADLYLCNNEDVDISSISDNLFVAYLNEVSKGNFGLPYSFKKDYVIINVNRIEEYKIRYLNSSPIWGSFFHESNTLSLPAPYSSRTTFLKAIPDLKFPTNYHLENSIRSVFQPYAFERYLKLYHLLELLFDWNIVQKIKNLGDDLIGIGQILSDYHTDEVSLLRSVIQGGCNDFQKISALLNQIIPDPSSNPPNYFYDTGCVIFFDYSKKTNPIDEDKFKSLVRLGGFSQENLENLGLTNRKVSYEEFLIKVTSYWIYRIRCCIAHNRISEYLMTTEDERFVIEFGEPLLREILVQVFQ